MTKAIIDFSGYAGPDLFPAEQNIRDSMTIAASAFPLPVTDKNTNNDQKVAVTSEILPGILAAEKCFLQFPEIGFATR